MKQFFVLFVILGWHTFLFAQVVPYEFRLGVVRASADADHIVIHASQEINIEILGGGRTWPSLFLDEDGRIYAGENIIDPVTGRVEAADLPAHARGAVQLLPFGTRITAIPKGFQIDQQGRTCSFSQRRFGLNDKRSSLDILKQGHLVTTASHRRVLALSKHFNKAGDSADYRLSQIDMANCSVKQVNLARTDMFVELGQTSRGGWWLTGSIEQSLLRSPDGIRWHAVPLPKNIHGLVSSYVVDDMEIWLAATNADDSLDDDPYLLFSDNGGRAWRTIRNNDPYLRRLPKGWLEGQQRIGRPIAQTSQQ